MTPPDLDALERQYEALIAREDRLLDVALARFSHIADEQAERMAARQAVARDHSFLRRLHRQRSDHDQ